MSTVGALNTVVINRQSMANAARQRVGGLIGELDQAQNEIRQNEQAVSDAKAQAAFAAARDRVQSIQITDEGRLDAKL